MSIHLNRRDSRSNKKCKQGLSLGSRVMDNSNFLPCIFLYFADLDHKLLCDQEKKNLLKYLRRLLKMYSAVIK